MARNGLGLYLRRGIWCFRYRDAQTGKWREKSTGETAFNKASRGKSRFLDSFEAGTLPNEMSAWTLKQGRFATSSWETFTLAKRRSSGSGPRPQSPVDGRSVVAISDKTRISEANCDKSHRAESAGESK